MNAKTFPVPDDSVAPGTELFPEGFEGPAAAFHKTYEESYSNTIPIDEYATKVYDTYYKDKLTPADFAGKVQLPKPEEFLADRKPKKQPEGSPLDIVFKLERERMSLDDTDVANLMQFADLTAAVESNNGKNTVNPVSSARGHYQFIKATAQETANKLDFYYEKAGFASPEWVDELRKHGDLDKLEKEQQDAVFFAHHFRRRGTDPFLSKIAQGDVEAMKTMYDVHHHTNPDEATITRRERIFNRYKPPAVVDAPEEVGEGFENPTSDGEIRSVSFLDFIQAKLKETLTDQTPAGQLFANLAPGTGEAIAASDLKDAIEKGDIPDALLAGLGVIPVGGTIARAGKEAAQGVSKIVRNLFDEGFVAGDEFLDEAGNLFKVAADGTADVQRASPVYHASAKAMLLNKKPASVQTYWGPEPGANTLKIPDKEPELYPAVMTKHKDDPGVVSWSTEGTHSNARLGISGVARKGDLRDGFYDPKTDTFYDRKAAAKVMEFFMSFDPSVVFKGSDHGLESITFRDLSDWDKLYGTRINKAEDGKAVIEEVIHQSEGFSGELRAPDPELFKRFMEIMRGDKGAVEELFEAIGASPMAAHALKEF